ncbi:MAG TPA: hypothetical protein VGK33_12620 [Chloroflexota bacterium]|jgi:hypothetical protein
MAEEQATQPVHATHLHSCGFCGSTAIQDQLEWPVGPLGGPKEFEVTCPDCGRTIEVTVDGDQWVSDKLVHEGTAPR